MRIVIVMFRQRVPIDFRIDFIGLPKHLAENRSTATDFEFSTISGEAEIVGIRRGGMVEDDAGDGEAAVQSSRGVESEQRVVDSA